MEDTNYATEVANMLFEKLEPRVRETFALRVLEAAENKWQWWGTGNDQMTQYIEKKIEELITSKYAPLLDAIADKKAREKVLRRAKQNGLELNLFDDVHI